MAFLELPNGKYIKVPEGMSPAQAYDAALQKFPNLLEEIKPKKGAGAALGRGLESFISTGQTALEALTSPEKAAEKGLRREEALGEKYAEQVSLDKVKEAYEKKGLLGAAGEVGRQVPLALLEQAPNIAATLGAAKVGAMGGSALGPVGTVVGAGLGALTPAALQLFGSNIQRQAAEQEAAGRPVAIDVGKAAGATAVQAPLDVAATFIPLGGRIAGKFFGKEVEQLLSRGGSKAAEKLAQETFLPSLKKMQLGTAVKGTAIGAAAEIPTEITQQMLERYQAGLPLTTPDALQEYGETAYQAGLLGPIGAVGRVSEKGAARAKVEAEQELQRTKEREQKAIQDKLEADQKAQEELTKAQQETGQLFGEALPEASLVPGARSTLTVAEKEATKLGSLQQQLAATTDPVEKKRLETEIARLKEQPTERSLLLKQADTYDKQLVDIEKQRDAAAEKGDFKQFAALDSQARALEESQKKITAALKEMPVDLTPDMEMAKLRGEQKNLIKQLQGMTGPSYDAKKAATVTAKLEEIDKRINEIMPAAGQMELFDEAQIGAEQRAAVQQQKEQRAQEQADLFAQVRGQEVLNREEIDRYQQSLQELEDAYAEGAGDRIIAKLIDELQRVGKARDEAVAKAGAATGSEQEQAIVKLQRIKRAIDEEAAKLASVSTDEEVNAIRTNIAALQKRYAIAQTERANIQPENVEILANQEQQDALLTAVEGVRSILSGDYLNSKNVDVASSLKSGIEANIRDAGAAYTRAAIKEINAVRAINKQQPLTNDEALKAAFAIKSRFDYLAKDPTYLAEKIRDSNLSILKTALNKIKTDLFKGPSKVQKVTPALKQERDVLGMLRAEKAKKEPDPKRIAQLEKEVAALKKEEEKIEAEKTRKEAKEPTGVIPEQRELFGEKELEPIAIVRATPQNFLRFVNIQKVRFEAAKKIAEATIKKPMQKVKLLFGDKYAEQFNQLESVRLRLENEYKKSAPELYTPSEADLKRYSKSFINARIKKAKEAREKYFANVKELEDTQKEILQKLRGTEGGAPVETLASKVAAQRQFVFDVLKADELASNLKQNATQLWQARGKIVKALEEAKKAKQPKKVKQYAEALKKLDLQAPEIRSAIDSLHARANELLNANLKTEKAILKGLEKQLANSQKGTPAAKKYKQEADAARARIAQAETERTRNLERQSKDKRELEEKQAAALKALPSTRQEIIETTAVLPGEKEVVKQKRVVTKAVPKTAAEKRAEMIAEEQETAKERKAIREQVKRGLTPQQLETEVKKFRAAAEQSRKKGNEKQAKRQEQTADSLEKQLKLKQQQARLAMTGVKDKKTAQPPKMRTGVAKEPTVRKDKDLEQEARDAGVSREDYEFVQQGLAFGFKARAEEGKGAGVSQSEVQARVNKVKTPKGLKIVVLDKLPPTLAERIAATGYKPENVRGGVLPDGTVIIVAENHTDMKDVERTLAHELIGHIGVEGLIGESGMKALAKQIQKTNNSVFELAKKLGVLDDVLGAYAVARKTKSEEDSILAAVRELIAHTEETRPDKNFLQKAGEFIKAMVGAVRAGLRKLGLDLDISTSDIYKLLRDARKDFSNGSPGAYVNKDGDIVFRTVPAQANAGFADVLSSTDKVIAKQKSLIDRIKGEATGLIFKTKYIDRFAPVQAVAKKMEDSLKATQLMYFLRMHDQRMAWNSEIASNGPLDLRQAKDGKGLIVESTPGANLKDMALALKDADVGNTEATVRVFTMYLAAKRAKRVGLNKLNFGPDVTQKMLDDAEKAVNASPKTKEAFEKAADIYAKYNEGLINFAVKTGAISKKVGADLLKYGDYVPFYRQTADGSVFLDVGGAPAIKIGNLKDQPYLHELVGGDQPILDVFTSALQNTSMLTDMALRNLATRNVAYALNDMGLLEGGKHKGMHKGDGPKGPTIIRFKMDGENYWADVNTDAAGVPAELLVKGLEGVNTALPNAVKMMNVPANLLRKWVTRNPAYALRQVIRDPLNAVFVTGVDTVPIASSAKEIAKMIQGKSEGEFLLQRRGILGGQVLTGTAEDMSKILRDVTAGTKGWDYRMAQLDQLAIKGDAATRVVMYNNFIKQGLSEMEATLATLEAMNFSKRGISPSLFALSTMVPFMNAQIQGLNVIYEAFTGQMPFSEKLKVKQKLFQRAAMMVGYTMLYASLMQDDESYQNANDDEKYGNWFMPNPLGDEYIKVPIPFEIGFLFKAVPEALVNTMFGDEKARDTMSALGKMAWNSVPISMPQGIKPALETAINYSFYTGRAIESERLQQYEPGERYTERTGELAKLVGGALNISPIKIEYLIRGYTGSLPLAIGSLTNPILRSDETGEKPEMRSLVGSETPLIGSFFQPKDAGGLINKAYKDMEDVIRAKETYKKMVAEGREEQAQDYLDANADVIAMGSLAGKFRQQMGVLTQQERAVRADSSMTGAEKREALDELRQAKIDLAKMFSSARE